MLPPFTCAWMFFPPFALNVATLAATPFSHSGNSTTSQMDELLIKSWSSDIMCKCPPAKPIVSGPSLSAAHHKFISSAASCLHLKRSVFHRVSGFSSGWGLLYCSVALLTGSSGWPDCCLVSEACSHMSAVLLTHPLFCTSSIWQDPFCLLFFDCYSFLLLLWARIFFSFFFVLCIFSCYPSPNCSDDSRQMAGWCRKTYMFMVFTQNAKCCSVAE